ncbi:MAG TPA: hypothetical protein PKK10_11590 [Woeseiaceae bacterium]|nr:hypothetical protein [Woeseiaceae bacterium]
MANDNNRDANDMVLEDHLILEYHGPDVEGGSMEARKVAAQIVAFSDFLDVVSESAYGERAQLRTEVQGFRGESFDIDFAYHVAGHVATLWSVVPTSPKEVIDLIKNAFALWRHLGAEPPKSTNHAGGKSQLINVENNNGQILAVSNSVFNVVANPKAGAAVGTFIGDPLKASGIDSVRIRSRQAGDESQVLKKDGYCFIPVDVEQPLPEAELETWLIIESPNFKEGNKWRVSDGQSSFGVSMGDDEFLQEIDEGAKRFGKGDMLRVRLLIQQSSALGKLSAERTIVKVLEHKRGAEQSRMFED